MTFYSFHLITVKCELLPFYLFNRSQQLCLGHEVSISIGFGVVLNKTNKNKVASPPHNGKHLIFLISVRPFSDSYLSKNKNQGDPTSSLGAIVFTNKSNTVLSDRQTDSQIDGKVRLIAENSLKKSQTKINEKIF